MLLAQRPVGTPPLASIPIRYFITATGGALAGGDATEGESESFLPTGGARCAGTATNYVSKNETATGGAEAGGGSRKTFFCASCCPGYFLQDSFWGEEEGTELSDHLLGTGQSWLADSGLYISGTSVLSSETGTVFATVNASHDDYTISATVTFGSSAGKVALVFRYLNSSNYWKAIIEGDTGALRIIEVFAGTETIKAQDLPTYSALVPYTLEALVKDSTIIASFAGTEVQATASSFLTQTTAGFLFSGEQDTALTDFCCQSPQHNLEMTGGCTAGGSATMLFLPSPIPRGGVKVWGQALTSSPFDEEMEGGAECGGEAQDSIRLGTTPSGGITVGGTAFISIKYRPTASGGATLGGQANLGRTYDFAPSGGVVISGPALAFGFQFRKLVTVTTAPSLTRFPLRFILHCDPALTITRVYATDLADNRLPSKFIAFVNGKLDVAVRTDLTDGEQFYVYFGGI